MNQGWIRLGIYLINGTINVFSYKPNTGTYVDNRTPQQKTLEKEQSERYDWHNKYYEPPTFDKIFTGIILKLILSFVIATAIIIYKHKTIPSGVFLVLSPIIIPVVGMLFIYFIVSMVFPSKNAEKAKVIFNEYNNIKNHGCDLDYKKHDIRLYFVRTRSKLIYNKFQIIVFIICFIYDDLIFNSINVKGPITNLAIIVFAGQYLAIGLSVIIASKVTPSITS